MGSDNFMAQRGMHEDLQQGYAAMVRVKLLEAVIRHVGVTHETILLVQANMQREAALQQERKQRERDLERIGILESKLKRAKARVAVADGGDTPSS